VALVSFVVNKNPIAAKGRTSTTTAQKTIPNKTNQQKASPTGYNTTNTRQM